MDQSVIYLYLFFVNLCVYQYLLLSVYQSLCRDKADGRQIDGLSSMGGEKKGNVALDQRFGLSFSLFFHFQSFICFPLFILFSLFVFLSDLFFAVFNMAIYFFGLVLFIYLFIFTILVSLLFSRLFCFLLFSF